MSIPTPEPGYRIPNDDEIVGLKWVQVHDTRFGFGWNGSFYAPEGMTAKRAVQQCLKNIYCDAIAIPIEGSAADIRSSMASLMGPEPTVAEIRCEVTPACKNCRFWFCPPSHNGVKNQCRRPAPCSNGWYWTAENDWCGEFQCGK